MTQDFYAIGKPVFVCSHWDEIAYVPEFRGVITEAYHGRAVVTDGYGMPWCIRWQWIEVD